MSLCRRLSALSGGVCRPATWRRRPIAFFCYFLSVSTIQQLTNRVRAAANWLEGSEEGRKRPCMDMFLFVLFAPVFISYLDVNRQNRGWISLPALIFYFLLFFSLFSLFIFSSLSLYTPPRTSSSHTLSFSSSSSFYFPVTPGNRY